MDGALLLTGWSRLPAMARVGKRKNSTRAKKNSRRCGMWECKAEKRMGRFRPSEMRRLQEVYPDEP